MDIDSNPDLANVDQLVRNFFLLNEDESIEEYINNKTKVKNLITKLKKRTIDGEWASHKENCVIFHYILSHIKYDNLYIYLIF